MRIKFSHIFLIAAMVFAVFYLAAPYDADASTNYNSRGNIRCDKKGTSGGCLYSVYSGDHQAWQLDYSMSASGHGALGPAGGNVGLSMCLSPGSMWNGACWNVVRSRNSWVIHGPCGGSTPPEPHSDGKIGDYDNCIFDGRRDIGGDPNPNFDFAFFEYYANDATWNTGTIAVYGRRVRNNGVWCSSNCNPKQGENFTISWDNEEAMAGTRLHRSGAAGSGDQGVGEDGSQTFNCSSVGQATFWTVATGPSSDGLRDDRSSNLNITCSEGQPGPFSLTQGNCYWHNNNHSSFELNWTQSQNATSYEIWRRAWSNGSWQLRDTVGAGTLSYHAHEGTNTDWYFFIRARNSAGSRDSNVGNDTGCYTPTVDLRANGSGGSITIPWNTSANLSWSSTDANSCSASGAWSGNRPTSGSASTGNITSSKTYTLTCSNPGGNGSDSVTVNVSLPPPPSVDVTCGGNQSCTIPWNSSTTIGWSVGGTVNSCSASGDWSGAKSTSGGSEGTGNLTQVRTYQYTLTCSGPGGNNSDTVNVAVSAPVPDSPANVTAIQPDYCASGPAATVSWTYSDPSGSSQQSYQVQIDDTAAFSGPEVDSGKVNSGSTSYFTGQGLLQFNTNYWVRVRVWNGYDSVSGWGVMPGNFKTPSYAYPQANFTWTANGISENPSPPIGEPVQFTDQTGFSGPVPGRTWSWLFGDGGSSSSQSPSYTYNTEGNRYVTLTATDNAGQACARTRGPLIIQKPIPQWIEIAPQ